MKRRRFQHRGILRALRGCDSGQALVETALTLPLLILLLLGAAELGQVTYAAIEVSNSARAGVQYAAMNGGWFLDTGSGGGIAQAAESDAFNVYGPQPTAFSVSSSYSCVCSSSADTATCVAGTAPTGCPNSHMLVTVTVNTQATFNTIIHLAGLPTSYTLRGQAIQQVLQ